MRRLPAGTRPTSARFYLPVFEDEGRPPAPVLASSIVEVRNPVLDQHPQFARFDGDTQQLVVWAIRELDKPAKPGTKVAAYQVLWEKSRAAFEALAGIRPELWERAGRQSPGELPDALQQVG